MRQFKVKAGKHAIRLPNGKLKVFKVGEVVYSTEDLCSKFKEKFEEVNLIPADMETPLEVAHRRRKEALKEAKLEEVEPDHVVEDTEDLPPEPEETPDYGREVTKKFSALGAEGLRVFFDDTSYHVMNDTEVIAGPLSDKTEVADWFKKWKKSSK